MKMSSLPIYEIFRHCDNKVIMILGPKSNVKTSLRKIQKSNKMGNRIYEDLFLNKCLNGQSGENKC